MGNCAIIGWLCFYNSSRTWVLRKRYNPGKMWDDVWSICGQYELFWGLILLRMERKDDPPNLPTKYKYTTRRWAKLVSIISYNCQSITYFFNQLIPLHWFANQYSTEGEISCPLDAMFNQIGERFQSAKGNIFLGRIPLRTIRFGNVRNDYLDMSFRSKGTRF